MTHDPRTTLARAPLRTPPIVVLAIAIALNGLDGFDVLFRGPRNAETP